MLKIQIISASNVPNVDTLGKSDPYVRCRFRGIKQKTSTKKDTLDPEWNETLEWDLAGTPITRIDKLEVLVKDSDFTRDKLLGKVEIPLRNVTSGAAGKEMELPLMDKDQRPTSGRLRLKLDYSPPSMPSAAGGSAGTATMNSAVDTSDSATGSALHALAAGGMLSAHSGRSAATRLPANSETRARDQMPDKETKFQVRVKVVEARQLIGDDVNPTCRVLVGGQGKSTHVQKSSHSPWFNEVFFFYIEKKPSQVWDTPVELRICNSRMMRSKVVLGTFRLDLGTVYDQPQHAFINKWLPLASQDEQDADLKGYLKVSMVVLGPHDECPELKASQDADDDDVEQNLLFSSQIHLTPASINMNIYQAEDLPRMDAGVVSRMKQFFRIGDSSNKQSVDPFVELCFAGKQVQTPVEMENCNPTFMQQLHIGVHLPSFAKNMKLLLHDWDRGSSSDTIACANIALRHISTSGEGGFLPTFGPSFVCFYGGTREFSVLDKEGEHGLNEGKLEGCAFRGRVLLSLNTTVGELPFIDSEPISHEDTLKIDAFLKRRSYLLHCAFEDAGMISEVNTPVEFELSMGNYGNKFESSQMPSPSFTQPTNAVYDGCSYYFLPWEDSKPCVTVPCQWEDISHRLYAVNSLMQTVCELERGVEDLKSRRQAGETPEQLASCLADVCGQLLQNCRVPLPSPEPIGGGSNPLDHLLAAKRRKHIDIIVKALLAMKQAMPSLDEAIECLEGFHASLSELAEEPQQSMPDVIIWMLAGKERLAYARIPAHTILFAENAKQRGANCGRIQSILLKFPGHKNKLGKIPGLLRVRLWLGKQGENEDWLSYNKDAETVVFAETYENQTSIAGHWVTKGPLMSRSKWSDADGDIKLPQESFEAPEGWTFDGDWFVDPEPSLFYEADAGHSTFLEDVFENEFRLPGGDWKPDLTHWSDVRKDPATPRDEREPPAGWKWDDAWQVDTRRAVDGDGWEYCVESSMGGYGPAQKLYHLCRRRRWVRPRQLLNQVVLEKSEGDEDGWAYAAFFGRKFHARHRKVDMVRRRRWHRKLMMSSQADAGLPIFKMSDSDSNVLLNSPMLYLKYSEGYKFQLRAHIYQARQLHSGDKSGLSDPYVCLSYLKKSYRTDHMSATVCPTWNQTIVLDEIQIHGSLHEIKEQPPPVVIEIYDHDTYGEPEFLGRITASPTVHLKSGHSPPLQWYPMSRGDQQQGELLASFELYCKLDDELPLLPPQNDNGTYRMPSEIRPVLQRTAVEILCWGVRNMKRYKLSMVQKPTVEFECAGNMVCSELIKNVKQHPNFDNPFLFMEVMLPSEPLYMPPLNIQIRDHRMFGDNPVVGSHVIKSLNQYRIEPLTSVKSTPLRRLTSSRSQSSVNQDTSTTVIDIETVPSEASTVNDKLVDLADTSEHTDNKRPRRGMGRTADKFGYEPLTEVDSPQHSFKDDETLPAQSHPPTPSRSVSIRGNFSGNRDFNHRRLSQQKPDTLVKKGSKSTEQLDMHDPKVGSSDKEQDWWSKYYASIGEVEKSGDYLANGYETLEVYPVELESVSAFSDFRDILNNFEMIRGKSTGDDESAIVGEFKGTVRVYALPDDKSLPLPPKQIRGIPSSMSEDLIVRVYVVRCWDLCPQDPSGMSDPFIMVKIGDEQKSTRKEYKPNTLNPIFGSCMEFTCTLPKEKELVVSLMDYDLMSKDDLIGETRIDLENRFMTRFRATCGLQGQYHLVGPNQWRDAQTPREILNIVCDMNNRPQPLWLSSTELVIGEQRYRLKDLEDSSGKRPESLGTDYERLALLVLQTFDLVPEHVETRRLFNPSMPDIEQGKVELFVDIFPASMGTPGPMVDITPRCPTKYVLRVVVYNVYHVLLQEYSAISGSNMSDVYVKCWLQGDKDVQKTDVHYRCMDGEAMFNWRFVFEIDYLEAEKMMVIKSKDHFWSLDEREQRRPPKLMLQLWDNDLISKDDYLGELDLDLSRMIGPARALEKCGLHQLSVEDHCASNGTTGTTTGVGTSADRPEPDALPLNLRNRNKACATHMDIWQRGRVRGFWPAVGTQDNERICAGKLEMEVEVVTAIEAEARPAAKAREEPNMNPTLQLPQRPATSFMWLSSPWKSFRYIIWRRYKWYVITVLVVLLLVLFVMLALYSLPGAAVDKLFGL